MATIASSDGFIPSSKDTPLDKRTRVNLYEEIQNIKNPYVGMEILVLADETNSGRKTRYRVESLKANDLGVENALIDMTTIKKVENYEVNLEELIHITKAEIDEFLLNPILDAEGVAYERQLYQINNLIPFDIEDECIARIGTEEIVIKVKEVNNLEFIGYNKRIKLHLNLDNTGVYNENYACLEFVGITVDNSNDLYIYKSDTIYINEDAIPKCYPKEIKVREIIDRALENINSIEYIELETTDNTIIGAINELKEALANITIGDNGEAVNLPFNSIDKGLASSNIDFSEIKNGNYCYIIRGSIGYDVPDGNLPLNNDMVHITKSNIAMTVITLSGDIYTYNGGTNGTDYISCTKDNFMTYSVAGETYQPKNDSKLITTDKTVVGAINELKNALDSVDGAFTILTVSPTYEELDSLPEGSKVYILNGLGINGDPVHIYKSGNNITITTIDGTINKYIKSGTDWTSYSTTNWTTKSYVDDAISNAQLGGGEVDLSSYQTITDNTLTTTDKTIVGAINEIKTEIDSIEVGGSGAGLATEQANQLATAYEHSQSVHVTSDDLNNIDAISLNGKKFSNPMTKAEYDAITSKDANTIYLVDDDSAITGVPDYSIDDANKVLAVNANGTALAWIDAPTGSGTGLTEEQASQLATAYAHSQSAHVQSSDIPTKTSDLTNDSNFATQSYVNSQIAEASLSGSASFREVTSGETFAVDRPVVYVNPTNIGIYGGTLEAGATKTLKTKLVSHPSNEEIITITTNEFVSVNKSQLIFNRKNYFVQQSFTVTALSAGEGKVIITAPNGFTNTATFTVTGEAKTISSISAVYTQGDTVVYPDTTLDSLKSGLVVTANYSDSTTSTVTDYELSGTLTEGTSVITVTYQGKTTTFNVTVTAKEVPTGGYVTNGLYSMYDLTQYEDGYTGEILDSVKNVVAVTQGAENYATGRNGFVGGKFMINNHKNGASSASKFFVPNEASPTGSYPHTIEVYTALRSHYNTYEPDGTLTLLGADATTKIISTRDSLTAESAVKGTWLIYKSATNNFNINQTLSTVLVDSPEGDTTHYYAYADAPEIVYTHAVIVIEASRQTVYINGKVVISNTGNSIALTNPHEGGITFVSPCNLKLIRTYNRALTADEVTQNYNDVISTMGGAE